MSRKLITKSREDLLKNILQLIRGYNELRSELVRFQLLSSCLQKYNYFLQQVIDENTSNSNQKLIKENTAKQQLLGLSSIKLCQIKLNVLQNNRTFNINDKRNGVVASIEKSNTNKQNAEKTAHIHQNQRSIKVNSEVCVHQSDLNEKSSVKVENNIISNCKLIEQNNDGHDRIRNQLDNSYSPNAIDSDNKDIRDNKNADKQVIGSTIDSFEKERQNICTQVVDEDLSFSTSSQNIIEVEPESSQKRVNHQNECRAKSNLCEHDRNITDSSDEEQQEENKSDFLLKKFKCDYSGCGNTYKYSESLSHHKVIHGKPKFKCNFTGCSYQTSIKQYLRDHQIRHSTLKQFSCHQNGCDAKFKFRSSLRRHVFQIHSELFHNKQVNIISSLHEFKCHIEGCDFSTKNKRDFNNHKRSHKRKALNKSHTCDLCDAKFKENYMLKKHMNKHEGLKPYICSSDNCGKTFFTANNLRRHQYSHKQYTFKCDFNDCQKSYRNPDSLRQHKQTHDPTKRRKYVCDWDSCGKQFIKKSCLKAHINTHTGEKPYACVWPGCRLRFSAKRYLLVHSKLHGTDRKHHCTYPECKYETNSKTNIDKHMAVHTGNKQYTCEWPGCEFKTANLSNLKTHKLKHADTL